MSALLNQATPAERQSLAFVQERIGERYTNVSVEAAAKIRAATTWHELIAAFKYVQTSLREIQSHMKASRDYIGYDCTTRRIHWITKDLIDLEQLMNEASKQP